MVLPRSTAISLPPASIIHSLLHQHTPYALTRYYQDYITLLPRFLYPPSSSALLYSAGYGTLVQILVNSDCTSPLLGYALVNLI